MELHGDGFGERAAAVPGGEISQVLPSDRCDVAVEGFDDRCGKDRDAVFLSLASPHDHLPPSRVPEELGLDYFEMFCRASGPLTDHPGC